ncbi:uncharacterized protein [Chelonus insularis]|uniref:uncharacterized protein n=1 Tax=Chelonus insularis TaxID=460826 RepID=UPI00158CDC73|nr:uncharacterized protein LOC118064635 [Chelonus insularis]
MSCYRIFEMIFCFLSEIINNSKPECFIRINDNLLEHQPLFLHPTIEKGFIYPKEVGTNVVVIKSGDSIRLACPGSHILLNTIKLYENVLFQCSEDYLFSFIGENIKMSIYQIVCDEHPRHAARKTSRSCEIGIIGEIGFFITNNKNEEFYKIIDFCHNEQWSHTVYAHTQIPAVINAAARNVPYPGFVKGEFFQGIAISKIYTKRNQREVLGVILNNKSLAHHYIQSTGSYYLARGHLIAKRDLIYAAQQRATFYYVNVVPMWQSINNGNWKKIEISIRNYASHKKCNLEVWAGTLEVLQLEDTYGNPQKINLFHQNHEDQTIPVPKILFKVVYDKISRAGIVFLTANNPYLEKFLENDYIICENVCEKINYIALDKRYDRGYSYCCSINDFRRSFKYLPYFRTDKLLI